LPAFWHLLHNALILIHQNLQLQLTLISRGLKGLAYLLQDLKEQHFVLTLDCGNTISLLQSKFPLGLKSSGTRITEDSLAQGLQLLTQNLLSFATFGYMVVESQ
jgi:hypothetical protein